MRRWALAAVLVIPIFIALALAFWPKPEPAAPGFLTLHVAERPSAEIRDIVNQLTREPQTVTAEGATTLGPDGYFSEIPRGSTAELTDQGWFVADENGFIPVLVHPENGYAYETHVNLVLREGHWKVRTVEQPLG